MKFNLIKLTLFALVIGIFLSFNQSIKAQSALDGFDPNADGATRTARTGSFGYYRFDDVEVGQTYIVSVASKRFVFNSQVVSVSENIADLDFTAQ